MSRPPSPPSPTVAGRVPFVDQVLLPFLLEAQNSDGGWGYRPVHRSGVEPTCWTVLALAGSPERSECAAAVSRGRDWLLGTQLADGSWPAFQGRNEGCWVTSLACLALHKKGDAPGAVDRGLQWLCNAWPGEGSFWRRLLARLNRANKVTRQNSALRGWSWTPGTTSWVEPTACALLLLRNLFPQALPPAAAKRQQLAEAMLYDRMCPDGGWNSGNPLVYGVAGAPLVAPAAWALLALENHRERAENQKCLNWLALAYEQIQGPGSLALAHLCLRTYGRPAPPLEPPLERLYAANRFLRNVPVTAFAAMALAPQCGWLRRTAAGARQ